MISRVLVFFGALLLLAGEAGAVTFPYPASMMYQARWSSSTSTIKFTGSWKRSMGEACAEFVSLWMTHVDPGKKYEVAYCTTSGSRSFQIKTVAGVVPSNSYTGVMPQALGCPDGGLLKSTGGSSGICEADPNVTPPAPVCPVGSKVTVTYKVADSAGKSLGMPPKEGSSDGECGITLVDVTKCYLGTDNAQYCQYVGERTGDAVSPGNSVPAPLVEAPVEKERTDVPPFTGKPGSGCPKGTVQGGMGADGIPYCIGTGSAPKNPAPAPKTSTSSNTVTNEDGSTTTTTTTTQTNADGSTTTTVDKVTTSPTGTVTKEQTKDTTSTPSGAPGRETNPQEQQSFCKQNPTLAVCRDSSVSGSCEQTSCTGDAIQCATLQAARAMECKARQDEADVKASALHQLGQAAATGGDPMKGTLPTPGNGEVVQVGQLKAEGWLGGGSPLKDTTFTVQGKSITIPFSKASEYLLALRYALMVVASLISFRMLSGVILRD